MMMSKMMQLLLDRTIGIVTSRECWGAPGGINLQSDMDQPFLCVRGELLNAGARWVSVTRLEFLELINAMGGATAQ